MRKPHRDPLVSVIIPAYREGALLARAIDSALAQSYVPLEVIVVNDGSPEPSTRQTAIAYGERIVYLERENGGVAAARNTGIAAAKGDLIALLDQDDMWLPHKLAVQVTAFRAHPRVALVHASYYLIDAAGRRTDIARLRAGEWRPLPSLLLDVPIAACTTLFPRHLLASGGPFDPALSGSDDWDLWLRLAARGYAFYCVGAPLAEYRVHGANTSRDIDLMVRTGLAVLDKFYALPHLPAVAVRCRDRALARRHAWAAACYYGAGRLADAATHMRQAAGYDPREVSSLPFLRSLMSAQVASISRDTAADALDFAWGVVGTALPRPFAQKLRSRAHLVRAVHVYRGGRRVRTMARAALSDPGILFDRDLWGAARRRPGRLLARAQAALAPGRCGLPQRGLWRRAGLIQGEDKGQQP